MKGSRKKVGAIMAACLMAVNLFAAVDVSAATGDITSVINNATAGSTVTLTGNCTGSPTLKASNVTVNAKGATLNKGVFKITGSGNKINDLKITNAPDYGIVIDKGSKNTLTKVTVSKANNYGIAHKNGGTGNVFDGCYSEYNFDIKGNGGNADGFGVKFGAGADTFKGCTAFNNSDDGWDFWNCGSGMNNFTDCIADHNGYKADGKSFTAEMNGMGFKCGGPAATGSFTFTSCTAKNNRQRGFKRNHTTGTITLNGCTSTGNLGGADLLGPND